MTDRESGYHLWRATQPDGGPLTMEKLRPIQTAEFERISDARRSLLEFRRELSVYDATRANLNSILRFHAWIYGSKDGKENLDGRMFPNVAYEMNRRLLNYTASCRLYVDYMERRLADDGDALKLFVKAKQDAYDGSPAYRLMEQLRNFVQHRGLPVGQMEYTAVLDDGKLRIRGDIFFDRDELLSDAKLNAKIKEDLRAGPRYISIIETVQAYARVLSGVHACALAGLVNAHSSSYKVLEGLYAEVKAGPELAPMVARATIDSGKAGFQIENLPLEAMVRFQDAVRFLKSEEESALGEALVDLPEA